MTALRTVAFRAGIALLLAFSALGIWSVAGSLGSISTTGQRVGAATALLARTARGPTLLWLWAACLTVTGGLAPVVWGGSGPGTGLAAAATSAAIAGLVARLATRNHMKARLIISFAAALGTIWPWAPAAALQGEPGPTPRAGRIPVGKASLYARDIGKGRPVIVLHGGPDFDQSYLSPDLDRWADVYHVIYYDQRGRGRSADQVRPTDVTLASDLDDLDRVRRHFGLQAPVLLGHSWGTVLALEYALRHPAAVSHLILMNPAPASAGDFGILTKDYVEKLGADMEQQREIMAGAAYQEGDPATVAARYRLHFRPALKEPRDYETMMERMKAAFISQGKEGIVKARAVEDRLMEDTWTREDYDLLPELRGLQIPTLILYGDHDFIPGEIARHIAAAMPQARLVTLKDCGHFAHLECAEDARRAVDRFLQRTR